MYGVGVGGGISTTELGIIASDKSKVYDLSSFSTSRFQDLQISTYTDSFNGKIVRATGGYRPLYAQYIIYQYYNNWRGGGGGGSEWTKGVMLVPFVN